MNKRINRFKLCDLRFYSYLARVIERLPEDVREMVLNDRSFQIITDDEVTDALVLRYEFGAPIRTLVYLNTKILYEPDHQIIHTIASEIAHYIFKKQGAHTLILERKLDSLLIEWGFKKEVEAVRYDQVVSQSDGYKIETDSVLEDILPSKKLGFLDSDIGKIPDSLSTRKTMLAGILTAVKESNLKKKI